MLFLRLTLEALKFKWLSDWDVTIQSEFWIYLGPTNFPKGFISFKEFVL